MDLNSRTTYRVYIISVCVAFLNTLIAHTAPHRITAGILGIAMLIIILPLIIRAAKIDAIQDALAELRRNLEENEQPNAEDV